MSCALACGRLPSLTLLSYSDWRHDPSMPAAPQVGQPAKEPSELADDSVALFPPMPQRNSTQTRGSFQLGRHVSRASITHDMSTGMQTEGSGRGYGYDEAPAAPLSIARYTSRGSDHSSAHARNNNRKRSGSVRLGGVELNREWPWDFFSARELTCFSNSQPSLARQVGIEAVHLIRYVSSQAGANPRFESKMSRARHHQSLHLCQAQHLRILRQTRPR